jgi:hypothetical protein
MLAGPCGQTYQRGRKSTTEKGKAIYCPFLFAPGQEDSRSDILSPSFPEENAVVGDKGSIQPLTAFLKASPFQGTIAS